ncbi:hypothetical protein [Sansalvadorimonas verongulae]|uniref:hypothetical protein n=1 Tax=Sansalvadorimonas verongulae TaxID=2172824 RepID=UPI0012BB8EE5|nr:hypothetical protein [Sansalvadorimonas verongulae]MTI13806.1 hypothetical protein [Sansalvadorimonas verongulae]
MRIKLPTLTATLCEAGVSHEQAIEAGNEVGSLVDGYRQGVRTMLNEMDMRLSRQLAHLMSQTMSRIDNHFIHMGNVQMEQHKQLQQVISGLTHLNERQDRFEERQDRFEERQGHFEERLNHFDNQLVGMDGKLDKLLKLLS